MEDKQTEATNTEAGFVSSPFDEQTFDTTQPDVGTHNWLLVRLHRMQQLKASAVEYDRIEKEVKEAVKEVADKKAMDFECEIKKPKPGRTVIIMKIEEFEITMDINRQRKFTVPADVRAQYEVDPNVVKKVSWKKVD